MALAVFKTYVAGEVLFASDLNSSLTTIHDNALALISPLTASLDAGGFDITAIDELALSDASADASAAGRLRRNSAALSFHNGSAARTIAQRRTVRNTALQTVNNSTTLVNATSLVLALAANEIVAFMAQVFYTGNGTADIQIAFTVPAGATIRWNNAGGVRNTTAGTVAFVAAVTASGTSMAFEGGTNGTATLIGTVVNSTTAGNLQLQFAQNTADASNTDLQANSWLSAETL